MRRGREAHSLSGPQNSTGVWREGGRPTCPIGLVLPGRVGPTWERGRLLSAAEPDPGAVGVRPAPDHNARTRCPEARTAAAATAIPCAPPRTLLPEPVETPGPGLHPAGQTHPIWTWWIQWPVLCISYLRTWCWEVWQRDDQTDAGPEGASRKETQLVTHRHLHSPGAWPPGGDSRGLAPAWPVHVQAMAAGSPR